MKHFLALMICIISLLLAGHSTAATERRVALVIGNDNYQNISKLEKAVNDANAVARELKKVGFDVMAYNNVGQKKMNQAINDFTQKVSGGGVGVFFFAGHGLQINNQNFLVPVDMDTPNNPNDVADQAISVPSIQDKLADAKAKFTLLVLDACRNNPLPKKAGRSIGSARGLAMTNSPNGQVVIFSAGANQEALDKLNDEDKNPNGLFTREFLPLISQPGVSAVDAAKKVRSVVSQKAKTVNHEQNPAIYDQTDGDFYFVPPSAASSAAVAKTGHQGGTTTVIQAVDPKAVELAFWDSIKSSSNPEDFRDYLGKYPDGQFAQLAKRRLTAPPVQQAATRDAAPSSNGAATQVAMAVPQRVASAPSIASRIEELGKMTNLVVSDLRAAKRDNLLRVQAEITNASADNQQLFYRFKWLDRDGFSVWEDEPWKPLIVYGKQKQIINVVSPSLKAADFKLMLQSPDNQTD